MKIIIYHTNIIEIGGVEDLCYYLSQQLSKYYEVTVIYKTCHIMQLLRLSELVHCEQYDPKATYSADICILNCSWGGYPEAIKAKEYWQMIHANYKELLKTGYKYEGWSKTTRHIAVSNAVAKNFKEIYGIDCDMIYNILGDKVETKPILKLFSATRLSKEKGYDRMLILAKLLRQCGIRFRWLVFANPKLYEVVPHDMEEFIFMDVRYDIFDYMVDADYGVQLSDTEGYSYFVNKCLQYGTPLLCTCFDSVYESLVDGKNGYILPMDMKIDKAFIDKIVNHIPKGFDYKPKTTIETWTKYIGHGVKKKRVPAPSLIPKQIQVVQEVSKKKNHVIKHKKVVR
jgi:glycosyltransferase involved in cell wall biosynthesis